jgi:GT2 family glycosyltransferase
MQVSIIVLNYNGSRFLRRLFGSLAGQTFKDFEVILVDNNSTDNSLQLLNRLILDEHMKNLRIKVVKNVKNVGYCQGNNSGIKYAEGEYIVFLNNDTYVSSSWLEELVKAMAENPSIGACQSRLIDVKTGKVQMDGRLLDLYGRSQGLIIVGNDLSISTRLFYASGASVIVKKTALLKIGGFDEEIFSGDHDLCWRLRLLGYEIAVALKSICYHYGSVATKMLVSSVKSIYNHNCEILRVLLKNYSLKNCIMRLPLSIIMIIIEVVYLSLKNRTPMYFISFSQVILWNLRRLGNTLIARHQIQNARTVDDHEIEKSMSHYSSLINRRWIIELI